MSWVNRIGSRFEWPSSGGRLRAMEGLRGLSAFLVFFVHARALFAGRAEGILTTAVSFLGALGPAGVDIFFVLSGFLIWDLALARFPGYFAFARRRVWRIYPVFLLVLAARVVHLTLDGRAPSAREVLANLLMLPGVFAMDPLVSVAWSLSWEMLYYLGAPLLILSLGMRSWTHGQRAIAALLGVAAVYWTGALGWRPVTPLAMFGAGICLREALRSGLFAPRLNLATELLSAAAFVSALAVQATPAWPGWDVGRIPFIAASYFAIGLHAFAHDGFARRAFSLDPVRWFGNMSYSFYLTHGPALHVAAALLPSGAGQTAAVLAGFVAATATSAAMFLLVEKPACAQDRPLPVPARTEPAPAVLSH